MFKEVINDEIKFYKQFESKKTLYGFKGLFNFESNFFESKEQLKNFIENNDTTFGDVCKIEFLGNILGRSDVIRRTLLNGNTKLYTITDEKGYAIYNYGNSLYFNNYIWNFEFGSLKDFYQALKDNGIEFEDDIYQKIDEKNKCLVKKCNKNFFKI